MVVLDTDHMSLLQRGGPDGQRIAARLRQLPPDDLTTTIVTFEEQVRGWMDRLSRGHTAIRQVSDYHELKRLLRDYCNVAVLEFDQLAAEEFDRLRRLPVRIGTMDLKIAAITLANSALLLTRNRSDFDKVPGLRLDDWSA